MENARPVLLVDFSALFRRNWHVSSEISHAFENTISGVNRAGAQFPDCLIAICCDGRGNWRKEIAKDYKANREAQPAALYGEMDRTLERLRKDGRLIWKCDGFEADDVMATATMMARTRGHEVHIATHDKDLYQLLGPGVDLLAIHMTPWEVRTHLYVVDKYGIETSQLADWLALKGDRSDNVIGCPGIGDKTATALLQKYQSIGGIYTAMEGGDAVSTPANLRSLVQHKEDVLTSRKLVALRQDAPIVFDEIYEVREIEQTETRDHMGEAEKDAERFFGGNAKDSTSPAQPETTETATTETQPAEVVSAIPPAAAAVSVRDKTPEEIEEVSRPIETALAVVEYSRQLEPRSFKEAVIYADVMYRSKIYSRYPGKESMAAAIVRGREMGFGAGASLDMFHVADFKNNGDLRLIMHAHLIIELAMRNPELEYFALTESDDKHATYEAKIKRNPKPTPITYTIEQARLANLVKPGSNWEKRPAEQLRKTSGVQLGRVVSPGATLGLYCFEEMGIDE